MAGESLLLDVADAVGSSQQVDWERVRSAARPDQRRSLDSLHALWRMFAAGSPRAPGRPHTAVSGDPTGPAFARFALGASVALVALQVAAVLATPWWWDRWTEGPFVVPHVLALASLSACALLLFVGGRRDHRARLLGAVFLLGASSFLQARAEILWVLPEVFMPALMWAFAREFPRVHRRSRVDDLARRMVPVSASLGGALWIANLSPMRVWLPFLSRSSDDYYYYWLLLAILVLPAIAAFGWRARGALAEESRGVRLLIGAVVVGTAPLFIDGTIEALWPAARRFGDEHRNVLAAVVFTCLLSTPWSMTYAVLAERALDVRLVVRASYRRLLTRRVLAAMVAAPVAALVWLLASQPDRSVADVTATASGRLLVAAIGAAALAAGCRKRLLVRLDAWVWPETTDHRRLLVAVGSELVQGASASQVAEVVTRSVGRGCGAPATLLVSAGAEAPARHFSASTAAEVAPLAGASAIPHALASSGEPIRVDPDDRTSVFALLPGRDAEWVVAASATAIVPVFGPGSEVLGLVVVGRRFDDRRLSPVDVEFVQALAATTGLALARMRPADDRRDAPPACECPTCGVVSPAGSERPCGCGVDPVAAPVPEMLAGKFHLERRLGRGGMGAVYLARDIGLQRRVAVKTLPSAMVRGLAQLTEEARAMAAVAHPAIAQIHGLETWRGRPLLVVEFLPGGTLDARLARGPLSPAEAVRVTVALSEALTALHDAGYVHGDVKPSNIGFASDGSPKLLDFGLARLTDDHDQPSGGTLPYLSPEVLRGGRAGGADDVWSLCVVLYEMVAGRRPFVGDGADEIADCIRRQRLRAEEKEGLTERTGVPGSAKLIAFAGSVLTAEQPARPATARAFADALRGF